MIAQHARCRRARRLILAPVTRRDERARGPEGRRAHRRRIRRHRRAGGHRAGRDHRATFPTSGSARSRTTRSALLLAWNREIVVMDRQVHSGAWGGERARQPHRRRSTARPSASCGLGNIGSAFARRVAALETTVIACDPYVDDKRFAALGVERVSLETLAERADYVSVHTLAQRRDPSPDRRGVLPAHEADRHPDQHARAAPSWTSRRWPARCGTSAWPARRLDVWEQEPVTADNPLLKMDNVDRHPTRRVLLVGRGSSDTRALWRGGGPRPLTGQRAPERREPRGVRAGSCADAPADRRRDA